MKRNSFFVGLLASLSLVVFYFVVMLLFTSSPSIAISQIRNLWLWFTILVIGFGAQFGLFIYLKSLIKSASSVMTVANTGISGVSMVACCAHHLADVLPLFGLAWLSVFLARYQTWLIGAGIFSNFVGIIYLLRQINKHQVYVQN